MAWLVLLTGCAAHQVQPGDPNFAPVAPERLQPPPPEPGALYRSSSLVPLFTDRRASHVGDIVIVRLNEQTSSSKSVETKISKDNSVTIADPNLFGRGVSIAGEYDLSAGIDAEREFTGDGESDQSNSLTGSITVTVTDVLPNGLLQVQGEKWIALSQGQEYIRLRGLIRSEDIAADNSILSTQVADARISYGGTGALADSNRMGWLARFFNSGWWPF
ncbi:MAG: flagellar basal body L-ring protein FlgH [Pseudomonadota bacterium]|nr:flagellar basal body L-ring protein FlgH [Pseudomonadota bacterium]